MIEYLREIETLFENALASLSEVWMDFNHEKSRGRKSNDMPVY